MIIVLAIDALEHSLVEEFNCENLKQQFYGKTNISEFSQPRTMVLWSSFMTGENKEREVLIDGDKEMWSKRWPIEQTFFANFKSPVVLDLPGFSYNLEAHEKSRELLKKFFSRDDIGEKDAIRREYNQDAMTHHRKIKAEFLEALKGEHEFVLGYFSAIDVIGHLNFGNKFMMKLLYKEADELAKLATEKADKLLILSDHGMQGIGMFGDHSTYGFWSTNFKDLGVPKIIEIGKWLV
jgi:hypothetical protein